MALALTSCRHNEEVTCPELAWDTLTHLYQQEDYTVPGISYQINVVLPKDSLCPAHTAMRQQLLDRLFGTSIAWEPDSLKLDLSDAHKCLDTYLNANQKALDKVAAEYAPGGVGEAQMATASLFWGNELKLSPVMVDDTFITFALFYYNYIGGVHGIYGTYYPHLQRPDRGASARQRLFPSEHRGGLGRPAADSAHALLRAQRRGGSEHQRLFETNTCIPTITSASPPTPSITPSTSTRLPPYPVGCHTFGFSAQEAKPTTSTRKASSINVWKL